MSLLNKTPQAPVKQTVESVQMDALKKENRYKIAISILVTAVVFFIGGYFVSLVIVKDAQSAVKNSIEVTLKQDQ